MPIKSHLSVPILDVADGAEVYSHLDIIMPGEIGLETPPYHQLDGSFQGRVMTSTSLGRPLVDIDFGYDLRSNLKTHPRSLLVENYIKSAPSIVVVLH
ncbi:unnamed protein product [Gordionus sp. m RMFG-2023]